MSFASYIRPTFFAFFLISCGSNSTLSSSAKIYNGSPVIHSSVLLIDIHEPNSPLEQKKFCSGVLIAINRILTAAHCLAIGDRIVENFAVEHERVVRLRVHPDYHQGNPENDLAILEIEPSERPTIPVASSELNLDGSEVEIFGYGADRFVRETATGDVTFLGKRTLRSGRNIVRASPHFLSLKGKYEHGVAAFSLAGDSGGPMVLTGESGGVVGINSTYYTPRPGGTAESRYANLMFESNQRFLRK